MDSKEKQNILRIVELLDPIDWIGFNSPEDTFTKDSTCQFGVIELLCDTNKLINLFKDVKHCEESKLFNAIVHITYGPNQSIMFIRFGYLNKTLRCLEAIISGNTTMYNSSRRRASSDSDIDDLSFLKGSKVKKIVDNGTAITCVLKFREPDARQLLIENFDDFAACNATFTYRLCCTYDVLMFVPDMNLLIKQWMKKER